MPFSGPGDDSLPDRIKKLSLEERDQWVGAFNGRFEQCEKEGGVPADCESSAFAVANAAIKAQHDEEPDTPNAPKNSDQYWAFMDRQVDQKTAEYNPIGGTDTKACGNCQWFIAPTSCVVVSDYPEPILPTGLSNLWRERTLFEPKPLEVTIVGESAIKAETRTEGGVEFKPSDYAVVPDASKPSTWKLRLAESKSGDFTVAQVARAITAMQPSGFRGQRVQLTSEQKTQAVSRIGTSIGKTGGTDEQKQNLRDRLDKVKEARTVDRILGALKGLLPARRSREVLTSGFKVMKDVEGDYRWVAWVTNRWRDRDNPPEIFEHDAHKEYVRYLDNGGEFPEAWLWHTEGTRWGVADWADYFDGFLVMSGTVDKGMEYVAQSLAKERDLGVSHRFRSRYSDEAKGIIGWYRSEEISPLPAQAAANPWTTLELIQQEVKEMDAKKREWLSRVLGDEEVARIETGTAKASESLTSAGVDFKEGADGPEPLEHVHTKRDPAPAESGEKAEAEPKPESKPQTTGELVAAMGEAAVKAMEESATFKGVVAAIEDFSTRLKALEKSDDEKIAAQLVPKADGKPVGHQASKADGNQVDPESEDGKLGPGVDASWFQETVMEGIAAGEPA